MGTNTNRVKDFAQWISETKHAMDPTGYKPTKWQDRRFIRNGDGKQGRIAEPIGDPNKGATKYRLVYDDGTDEVLSVSAIRKHFEFYKES
jgi:hypothetical protein